MVSRAWDTVSATFSETGNSCNSSDGGITSVAERIRRSSVGRSIAYSS